MELPSRKGLKKAKENYDKDMSLIISEEMVREYKILSNSKEYLLIRVLKPSEELADQDNQLYYRAKRIRGGPEFMLLTYSKYIPMCYAYGIAETGIRFKHQKIHLTLAIKKLFRVEQYKNKRKLVEPVRVPLPLQCQCPVRLESALHQVHPLLAEGEQAAGEHLEKRKHMEKLLMPVCIHLPLLCPRSVRPEHALPKVLPLQAEEEEAGRN